jgi:hypothetical protein
MKRAILATLLSLAALTSNAGVITFDNAGAQQNNYSWLTTYEGFEFIGSTLAIDTVGGYWNYGAVSGDFTMYSVYGTTTTVKKAGGADFTFDGLWAKTWGNASPRTGHILGYNNGAMVFDSSVALTSTFTEFSGKAGMIDELRIDMGYYLVDNLNLNAQRVPEPASLALLGLGLAGISVLRRRKQA